MPLLEKCLTEDPSHERALLLLTDCLLDRPGAFGSTGHNEATAARSRTGNGAKISPEIKTISKKSGRAVFLSKNGKQLKQFFGPDSKNQHPDENMK